MNVNIQTVQFDADRKTYRLCKQKIAKIKHLSRPHHQS